MEISPVFFRDLIFSMSKHGPIISLLKCFFLYTSWLWKVLPSQNALPLLPLSFPLSLNGVSCQVPSVTLQNSCFFSFSIGVATSLSLGYFLRMMKVASSSKPITRVSPAHHYSQDASGLLRRPCKSFIVWPRTCLECVFCAVPSGHTRLPVLSEHLELFVSWLLLLLGKPSLPFYIGYS